MRSQLVHAHPNPGRPHISTIVQGVPHGAALPRAILLIDQFEEMFVDYRTPDERHRIGLAIGGLLEMGVKVLCSVRSDYLLDLHDLATPFLSEPLATRTVFKLRNLSELEASEVIVECAGRDRVEVSAELAKVTAAALSQGGEVRATELQIVCSAFTSGLGIEEYRQRGGARGILADYVREAIESCPSPPFARVALRHLCDFDAVPAAKRAPQTLSQLAQSVSQSEPQTKDFDLLRACLSQLRSARLVTTSPGDSETSSLVHDYLVGAIAAATSDVATEQEKSTQLLKLYLHNVERDPRFRISMDRVRYLEQHASSALLGTDCARQLLRRSRHSARVKTAGSALALVTAGVAVFEITAVQWVPRRQIIGRHAPGINPVSCERSHRAVWCGVFWGKPRLTEWDAETGANLLSEDFVSSQVSPNGAYVIGLRKGAEKLEVMDVKTKRVYPTDLPCFDLDSPNADFSTTGKFVYQYDERPDEFAFAEPWVVSIYRERAIRFRNVSSL